MNWVAKEGYDMYMEFPRSTCKDKTVKGYVECCGALKWCEKNNKNKENKKEINEGDSKLVAEIKKVKKKQKQNNKDKGD